MKKFIKKIIFFSLPLLICAALIEAALRSIPNDYLFKKQYLDSYSSEIETLILGSSHSFYGLNPDYFSSRTFNAGYIAQSLKYDYEILKKYKDIFYEIKTIILPISYFSLYYDLESDHESWRVKNYILYYDLKSSSKLKNYSEVLSNKGSTNIKRLINYYISGESNISCTASGYGKINNFAETVGLIETGKIAAKRHTKNNIYSKANVKIFNQNILILNSILDLCKERNIKVILFTPPAFHSYIKSLNNEQLNITVKTTKEICSKYNNCIYKNLLNDENFTELDFYDADHLSERGAEKLSRLINHKINELK